MLHCAVLFPLPHTHTHTHTHTTFLQLYGFCPGQPG